MQWKTGKKLTPSPYCHTFPSEQLKKGLNWESNSSVPMKLSLLGDQITWSLPLKARLLSAKNLIVATILSSTALA